METYSLEFIIGVGLAVATIGMLIGFVAGRRKIASVERDGAKFEAKASELQNQVGQKEAEIKRLTEQDGLKQTQLTNAETARARVETELRESQEQVTRLNNEIALHKNEASSQQGLNTSLQTRVADLNAKYNASVESANEQKDLLAASKREIDSLREELSSLQVANANFQAQNADLDARLEASAKSIEEQKNFIAEADKKLREVFESLSSEALRKNNVSFIEIANEKLKEKVAETAAELEQRKQAIDSLVKPLGESLSKFDEKLGQIELKREGAYSKMETLLDVMKGTTDQLNLGTKQLVTALKTSHVRGRYGEIGLRRIVEAARMTNYCHFTEQDSVATENGKLRPDMTIHLPGNRKLILDSKCPLASYMKTFETDDESEQINCLKSHAVAVRAHLRQLGDKSYWEQFADAPDFVIMYLEIESSYGAALTSDSDLIVDALKYNIVFATPSTLIGMLRTLGFMWQQEKVAESILEMRDAGIELYNRTATMLEHFAKVGVGLKSAVDNYNYTVGSLESRVITHLVKIKDIGGTLTSKELPQIGPVDTAIRPIVKSLTQ